MYKVQRITDYPSQRKTLNLPDGNQVKITLKFVPMQMAWFITSLEYGDFVVNTLKVVTTPNLLRAFKNIIPFGLAILCSEDRDPMFVEDFLSEKVTMYLLSQEEVQQVEDKLNGD